jgi:hypothetical protein
MSALRTDAFAHIFTVQTDGLPELAFAEMVIALHIYSLDQYGSHTGLRPVGSGPEGMADGGSQQRAGRLSLLVV